ncbi:MAG TPA: YceI family protein [Actinomycetota bacterium]|nr:YceI family protein [Actinomycetota bacterium]
MEKSELGPANGSLMLYTGVEGRAARMGHSLELAVDDWNAEVTFAGQEPESVMLAARLASLRVEAGHGLKPLTSSDEHTILRHARDCLGADATPEVTFVSTSISRQADSVAIQGQLSIAGQTRSIDATVALTDEDEHWTVVSVLPVKQSDFGVTPYATMLGMLQVADEVRVEVRVAISK